MGTAVVARANGKKGGRPAGAIPKISRRKAEELYTTSRSPLDVMIDNMNFWWDKSKNVGTRLDEALDELEQFKEAFQAAIVNMEPDDQQKALKEFADKMKMVGKMAAQLAGYREKAQECAVDAAPYCHPKFTSISWSQPGEENEIIDITPQLNGRISVTTVIDATFADSKARANGRAKTSVDIE